MAAEEDLMLMETEPTMIEPMGEGDMEYDGEDVGDLDDAPMGNLPEFNPVDPSELVEEDEVRKLPVPPHRYTPLKNAWEDIVDPIVNVLGLQIMMNLQSRRVEIMNSEFTTEAGALQKAADFVKAFLLGFDLADAMALLRLDDLYIDSFEIDDVKRLGGSHKSRAIGRICGSQGKTKHTIENALRVRIVVADSKIHILGAFTNIKLARRAVSSLIMGTPPGKVYGQLRAASSRLATRY